MNLSECVQQFSIVIKTGQSAPAGQAVSVLQHDCNSPLLYLDNKKTKLYERPRCHAAISAV
ncbi:hypothetical protein [Paenibacillus sp. DMB5]|uniref:hypothetical protein n=1 Tax=Paenibacillus sp. DMB5 TaxID=1780103 RepID=UPI000AEC56B7|nr:hypothetical protein [Paenibacillus sp. DMB5]